MTSAFSAAFRDPETGKTRSVVLVIAGATLVARLDPGKAHALDLLSAKGERANLAETHAAADKLASRFHCRPAGRCDERQILHDIAAALRRATEPDPRPLLGLLLHDARALLAEMRAGPERLDQIIDANTEARAA